MGDAAAVLTTARWSEDTYYLKEFVHKFKFPQVAKVCKEKKDFCLWVIFAIVFYCVC